MHGFMAEGAKQEDVLFVIRATAASEFSVMKMDSHAIAVR